MFWATWFKDQVVEVKILIISLTFDLTTTAPTTTQVNIDKLTKWSHFDFAGTFHEVYSK